MDIQEILAAWTRPDVLPIVGLGLLSVLLRQVPIVNWLFVPFRVLNTFIHEFCHVLTARLMGWKFQRFHIFPSGGGVTQTATHDGRGACIVASAGYLGAALFGGLLILLSGSEIPSRTILLGLGVLLGALTMLFVGNGFGALASLALAAGLYWAGGYLDEATASAMLLFLATQTILASFSSLFIQLRISRNRRAGSGGSDAEVMEAITAIPAVIWALLWCLVAVAILIWSVTVAYR